MIYLGLNIMREEGYSTTPPGNCEYMESHELGLSDTLHFYITAHDNGLLVRAHFDNHFIGLGPVPAEIHDHIQDQQVHWMGSPSHYKCSPELKSSDEIA